MSGNVVSLPDGHRAGRVRRDLARHLREIADLIEADQVETEPHAFWLVLTGMAQHEVLYAGYAEDGDGFRGALSAAGFIGGAAFPTRGGPVRRREGEVYGRPYRNENVVDFGAPRSKPKDRRP
ncbi:MULTISPECIES: hypothetical protein [Methylorubrum]|uniref:hypothetical protein n=1 Tax=Methylorubrum TaxID=2282523 RepID=UPI0020A0C05A|nr:MULTISPECIES: hypothetical protein [Methylorubrum]MCP1550651.1 hypothetical protein [Methylorubrum zatmanii]MCP1552736.1 hypothetical protein [Methylorubrum extorquens]MCP1580954.1 hypothetical protein [Methylorubrum extorquens]